MLFGNLFWNGRQCATAPKSSIGVAGYLSSLLFLLMASGVVSAAERYQDGASQKQGVDVVVASSGIQPPFVLNSAGDGLTNDLILAMNKVQTRFRFEHRIIPANRAYQNRARNLVDVLPFGSLLWELKKYPNAVASATLLRSGDYFIARADAKPGIFEDILSRRLVVVRGYSYAIFDFELDHNLISKHHSVMFTRDEESVARMILHDRAEIGIVDGAVLDWLKIHAPQDYARLQISVAPDKVFDRQFIVLDGSPVQAEELNDIFIELSKTGALQRIFESYGLPTPSFDLPAPEN